MYSRFSQIFYGLLIVVFDLSINHFDVLPDWLGFALVASGCGGLAHANKQFAYGSLVGWLRAAISFAEYFVTDNSAIFLGYLEFPVDAALNWYMLGGIAALATRLHCPDLALRAQYRRLAYLVIAGAGFVLNQMATVFPESLTLSAAVVLAGAGFILYLMILHLIYRSRRELTESLTDWYRPASGMADQPLSAP